MVDRREAELILRARMGLPSAYEELLEPLLLPAARLAYGMVQNRWIAEDSVQEAALLGWQRLENLEPGRSFRPWFLGIVANRCREALRSRWLRSVVRMPESSETPHWPHARTASRSHEAEWLEGADLRRALARLPQGQRAAIVLHFYLDLPLEEVAVTLGLGIAGVKARINRGLRGLRLALQAER
jgi:RNA polymerase sigma-70 factor, ECF subfamily